MGTLQSRQYYLIPLVSAAVIGAIVTCRYFRVSFVSGYKYKRDGRRRLDTSRLRTYRVHNGRIKLFTKADDCEAELSKVDWDDVQMVGLDCEWSRKPVALIQLALPNGSCYLVQVCRMVDGMPPTLESVLANKSILKFGVEIANDAKRIHKMCGCQVNGCVDLRYLYIRSGLQVEDHLSLKSLTRLLLGMELPKSYYIRCSNWEAIPLSNSQKNYAAADATVAVDIVDVLVKRKLKVVQEREFAADHSSTQPQPRPLIVAKLLHEHPMVKCCDKLKDSGQDGSSLSSEHHSRDEKFTKEFYNCLSSMCQGIVDLVYRHKPYIPEPSLSTSKSSRPSLIPSMIDDKPNPKQLVCQQPYYHNCQLLSPDGTLLSTVSRKKLDWYLERNLGEMVDESPPTVKLHFEPKGKPQEDRKFYLAQKEDRCVVCGVEKNFIRKHVIPLEYRKNFPVHMKEHLSHDVLLLCPQCHRLSCRHDSYYREYLASYYNAPINGTSKLKNDVWLQQVRNHARALQSRHKIPKTRVQQLLETLKTYYNTDDITDDMIQEAADVDPRSANDEFVGHGQKVVDAVTQEGKLIEFQSSWRKHFVNSMKPRYLPPLWSVDHNPTSS